jgi:hypothetical protein
MTGTITSDYTAAIASEAQARDATNVLESATITTNYTSAIAAASDNTEIACTAVIAAASATTSTVTDDHETGIAAIEAYITAQGGAP